MLFRKCQNLEWFGGQLMKEIGEDKCYIDEHKTDSNSSDHSHLNRLVTNKISTL